MAISTEEQKLREEARKAILKSAKDLAEKAPNHTPSGAAELLRAAAEAYTLVAGDGGEDEPDESVTS